VSQRLIDNAPIVRTDRRPAVLPSASESGKSSLPGSISSAGRLSARAVLELRRARTSPAGSRDGLSRTLRELATNLAISRRDCRKKQAQIEALKSEIGRLRAPVSGRRDQVLAGSSAGDGGDGLGARRLQHEHTLAWMLVAVPMLRRGNLAVQEENAGLRLELQRVRAWKDRRSVLATAKGPC
jgi:hypothetical protein